jgi:hypothetical protein
MKERPAISSTNRLGDMDMSAMKQRRVSLLKVGEGWPHTSELRGAMKWQATQRSHQDSNQYFASFNGPNVTPGP